MTDVANVTLTKASLPSTAWLMVRALVTLSLLVMKERWVRHFSSFLESTWLVLGTNTVKDQLKLDPFVLHLRRGKKETSHTSNSLLAMLKWDDLMTSQASRLFTIVPEKVREQRV